MDEYIEPTPQAKRFYLAAGLIFIPAGLVLAAGLLPPPIGFIKSLPLCEQLRWYRAEIYFVIALIMALGAGAAPFLIRQMISGQVPPPGTWVLRRTLVRRGPHLRWSAAAGLLLLVIALAMVAKAGLMTGPLMSGLEAKACEAQAAG